MKKVEEPYLYLTGEAGAGKTYQIRETIDKDPTFGKLTASTGAAARVLGAHVQTFNAALRFFDLEALQKAYDYEILHRNMKDIKKIYDRIVIDEASMMQRPMFNIIYTACKEVGLGLWLVGDFLQLPPATEKKDWLFESPLFKEFPVRRLKTQYRHTDANFIAALNFLRKGNGASALPHLKSAGVTFKDVLDWTAYKNPTDMTFEGTTLVATNARKSLINKRRYNMLTTPEVCFTTERSGYWTKFEDAKWAEIPDVVRVKVGARVMILANLYNDNDVLIQANGECGTVLETKPDGVILKRDDGSHAFVAMSEQDNGLRLPYREHGQKKVRIERQPTAAIRSLPIALAWSINVHKAQGLTLNHPTQVDIFGEERNSFNFFSSPAMMYVAISRVKKPSDLTIVGANTMMPDSEVALLEKRTRYDERCKQWI